MSNTFNRSVNCPTCQKPTPWGNASEFRPFCSERCKLIDFGEWATEKHSIPGQPVYPVDDDGDEALQ